MLFVYLTDTSFSIGRGKKQVTLAGQSFQGQIIRVCLNFFWTMHYWPVSNVNNKKNYNKPLPRMAGQPSRGASLICISNENNIAAVLNVTPWRLFKVSPTGMKCSKQVISANLFPRILPTRLRMTVTTTKNNNNDDKVGNVVSYLYRSKFAS